MGPDDEYTHSYMLIVNKDQTYEIRVDDEEPTKGNMKEDWSFEKPKMIPDPDKTKPDDWVDDEKIGMMNQQISQIQMQQNLMIGMMKKMENGKLHRLIIQNIKENGNQIELIILIIRDHMFSQRLLIQIMWKQKMSKKEDLLDILVLKYGRLKLELCLVILY